MDADRERPPRGRGQGMDSHSCGPPRTVGAGGGLALPRRLHKKAPARTWISASSLQPPGWERAKPCCPKRPVCQHLLQQQQQTHTGPCSAQAWSWGCWGQEGRRGTGIREGEEGWPQAPAAAGTAAQPAAVGRTGGPGPGQRRLGQGPLRPWGLQEGWAAVCSSSCWRGPGSLPHTRATSRSVSACACTADAQLGGEGTAKCHLGRT